MSSTIFHQSPTSLNSVLRQSARKQLDSYADAWIALFEGIQNALDAVEDNPGDRVVQVVIDPGKNEVTVSDNGKGFPPDKVNFALGKGTKGDLANHNIRGEHGVGMKMIILCSDRFQLWSKQQNGQIFHADFTDGYRFLNEGERESLNLSASSSEIPDGFTTTIKYSFPIGENAEVIRPINLRVILNEIFSRYDSSTPHRALRNKRPFDLVVEHYFRTSCYTGDVNRLFDTKSPATVQIIVRRDIGIDEAEWSKHYSAKIVEYWQSPRTVSFPAKYWDPTEWYPQPAQKGYRLREQLRTFNPSVKTPNQMWVLKLTDAADIRLLLENPHIRSQFPAQYFDDFITHKVLGVMLVIAPASQATYNIREVMYGNPDQVIAADGVVTTNQIRTPKRGKNQNYLNNIHFVINLRDRVNYGKQGVKNPLLLSKLYQFFEEAYVLKLVELAVSVAGRAPISSPQTAPDVSVVGLPKILDSDISIKRIPLIENTLIALTHELIALGRVKGLSTYMLHSTDQYDGKGLIEFRNRTFVPERDSDLDAFEYKVRLSALVGEFEEGSKSLHDIKLIIVWENDLTPAMSKYQILELEHSNYDSLNMVGPKVAIRNIETGDEAALLVIKELVTVEQV